MEADARVPHAGQVDADDRVPQVGRHLVPPADGADAGVGHHDVEAAELGHPVRHGGCHARGVADVDRRRHHPATGLRRPAGPWWPGRPAWPWRSRWVATGAQTSRAMMSAPSAARRTAWLRPWPRAAPVTRATLPARPTRAVRSVGRSSGGSCRRRGRGPPATGHTARGRRRRPSRTASRTRAGGDAVAGPQRPRTLAGRAPRRAGGGRSRRPRRPAPCGSRRSRRPRGGPARRPGGAAGPAAPGGRRPAAAGCWRRPGRR